MSSAQPATVDPKGQVRKSAKEILLQCARLYAQRGWAVFPVYIPTSGQCSCPKSACTATGKHPCTAHGFLDATTDVNTVKTWWEFDYPLSNVGIRTGKESGLVVLDVDPRHGGDETLRQLEEKHEPLPETVTVMSGGGGTHFYFQHPGFYIRTRTDGLGVGLDFKGDKGSIIAPPSLHASGQQYRWAPGKNPEQVPLATLPEWMLPLLREDSRSGNQGSNRSQRRWGIGADGLIPEGQRNETLFRIACQLYRAGLSDAMVLEDLLEWNMEKCASSLPEHEILQIVRSAARYVPDTGITGEPCTELGNARRLIARHGRNLRYVSQWKKWLIWNGTCWAVDDKNEVTTWAKETLRNLYGELTGIEDAEKRQNFARHLARSESHHQIAGMLKLAESEPGMAVSPNTLDANPWSLNVRNGTLDLHTGQLRPHQPMELLTKVAPVDYNAEAQCPTWDAFLSHVLGEDGELIRFVQKAVGYTLTGSTEEQCFFMLYGSGANGKSTFLQTLSALLGDYARQTPTETLLVKSGEGVRNDLARLQGARFVAAVEAESGKRLAEVLVKQLTGGDTITARYLYGEYFEYVPTFKVWLAVNHKPVVQGTDHAIWRRIHVLPFTVTIPEAQRDKQLMGKLQAELHGILRWAAEGCLAWQREGLIAPPVVKRATGDYRAEMDVIAAFLNECCVQEPEQRIGATALYKEYQDWCAQTGEQAVTQKAFGTALAEQGFTPGRKASERYWQGITLREE